MAKSDDIVPVDGAAGPALRVALFNGLRLEGPGGAQLALNNRKARGLLAYLATCPGMRATRETLATLLWSDREDALARTSLRQCLRQIRLAFEATGLPGLACTREEVCLSCAPCPVRVDLAETGAMIETSAMVETGGPPEAFLGPEYHPALLLNGYEDLDPCFTEWIRVQRQLWETRYTRFLRYALSAGDAQTTLDAASTLIAIDSTHEEAHRALIRHHAASGNVPAALRQYETLWNLLSDDYDMEPDEETQALIAQIKSGSFSLVAGRPAPALIEISDMAPKDAVPVLPRRPVIGVWRFVAAGPWNQKDDGLIEGLRRDLIAALVRFREWVVIEGRTHLEHDPHAQEPDYAVEGSFYEEDGTVHLVVTLKDAADNRYIWSEQVALSFDGWLSVRRRLVRKIAISLNIYLSVDEVRAGMGSDDEARRIYSRWLAAQELSYRWRPEDETRAERELRRLILEAPSFAPAYSSLVQIINSRHHVFPGRCRSAEQHSEALELARRAVEHDRLDCRTRLCLAWSCAMSEMHGQAAMNYRLAHKLNENDPWALVSCALGLAYCDALDEAVDLERQAEDLGLDLSPLHWAYRAGVRFMCGDYEGCTLAAHMAEDSTFYIPGWNAAALGQLGRIAEARAEATRFVRTISENWYGPMRPTPEAIGQWFLSAFPIRRRDVVVALRDGLGAAGITVPEAAEPGLYLQCAKV